MKTLKLEIEYLPEPYFKELKEIDSKMEERKQIMKQLSGDKCKVLDTTLSKFRDSRNAHFFCERNKLFYASREVEGDI